RLRDVRRAQVDVIRTRGSVLEDGLLQTVLVVGSVLAQSPVAMWQVASRAVDLAQEVGLLELAIFRQHLGAMQGIAHPQVTRVLHDERATLGGGPAHGAF